MIFATNSIYDELFYHYDNVVRGSCCTAKIALLSFIAVDFENNVISVFC